MAQDGQNDAAILGDYGPEILRDHASWLWNTYSGLAPVYSWPRLLPGSSHDPNMPGDFPLDFCMVANSCVLAFSAYLDRASADSACTTKPVNLSSQLPGVTAAQAIPPTETARSRQTKLTVTRQPKRCI